MFLSFPVKSCFLGVSPRCSVNSPAQWLSTETKDVEPNSSVTRQNGEIMEKFHGFWGNSIVFGEIPWFLVGKVIENPQLCFWKIHRNLDIFGH